VCVRAGGPDEEKGAKVVLSRYGGAPGQRIERTRGTPGSLGGAKRNRLGLVSAS
jgi:hypothetical protein